MPFRPNLPGPGPLLPFHEVPATITVTATSCSIAQTLPPLTQTASGLSFQTTGRTVIVPQAWGVQRLQLDPAQFIEYRNPITPAVASIAQTLPVLTQATTALSFLITGKFVVVPQTFGIQRLQLDPSQFTAYRNTSQPTIASIAQTLPSLTQAASGLSFLTTGRFILIPQAFGVQRFQLSPAQFVEYHNTQNPPQASIAQTLPSLTQAVSETTTVSASIAQTLPSLSQSLSGLSFLTTGRTVFVPQAWGIQRLQLSPASATIYRNNIQPTVASIAQTLPSLTQTTSGLSFLTTGRLVVLEQPFGIVRLSRNPAIYISSRSIAVAVPVSASIAQTLPSLTQAVTAQSFPWTGRTVLVPQAWGLQRVQLQPARFTSYRNPITPTVASITQTLPSLTQSVTALSFQTTGRALLVPQPWGISRLQLDPARLLFYRSTAIPFTTTAIAQTLPSLSQAVTEVTTVSASIAQTLPSLSQSLTAQSFQTTGRVVLVPQAWGMQRVQLQPGRFVQYRNTGQVTTASIAQTLPSLTQASTAQSFQTTGRIVLVPQAWGMQRVQLQPGRFTQYHSTAQATVASIAQTLPSLSQAASAQSFQITGTFRVFPQTWGITRFALAPARFIQRFKTPPSPTVTSIAQTLPSLTQSATEASRVTITTITILPKLSQAVVAGTGARPEKFVAVVVQRTWLVVVQHSDDGEVNRTEMLTIDHTSDEAVVRTRLGSSP